MNRMSNLRELDALVTEIASLVYRSPPMPGWDRVTLHARSNPDGSTTGYAFDFHLKNGTLDRGSAPPEAIEDEIRRLARRHWSASEPRWTAMHITVTEAGKVQADWEYSEAYQVGDVLKRG
jgi:hypothetical protein